MNYAIVFILAMVPISEIRGALLYGITQHLSPLATFIVALVGSSLAIILLVLSLEKLIAVGRTVSLFSFNKHLDRFLNYKTKQYSNKIKVAQELFLVTFVAIPLPLTGFITGALLAILFKFNKIQSIFLLIIGNAIAGVLVLLSILGVIKIFHIT